ncbi:MAG: glycosyltransferase family 2 protein, partial [Clostridium sp.]
MANISILIPVYNEEKYILQCLESIENQTYDLKSIEVIVIDGKSSDGTVSVTEEFNSKSQINIKVVENPSRTAPFAMNIGVRAASGDIIIRIDGHAYMEKDFVEQCVLALEKHKSVVCVGGSIITINENAVGEAIALAMSSPFGVGDAKFRYSQEEVLVDTLAFGAYRKEIFDKVGMFDEELVRNQDDEFNFRVTKSGEKILLNPKIKSYYYGRSSVKKLFKQYFQYGYWKVRVGQKHKQVTSIRQLIPFLFVTSIIGLSILSFFSKIFAMLLLAEVILYTTGLIVFSVKVTSKANKLKYLYLLPVIFLTLHTS